MTGTTPSVALPAWWPDVLRRFLGIEDLTARSLAPFAAPLARLSASLNDVGARRASHTTYMRDARLRLAYQLYYVTVNLLKPLWLLAEVYPSGIPAGPGPFRVLDLGCGPGTGVAAMHAWIAAMLTSSAVPLSPRAVRIDGVDAVEANAERYRELGALLSVETGYAVEVDARYGDATRPGGDAPVYDLVLAMNLLNEIPEARHRKFLERCGAQLADGGRLLLIEPALRETTRPLLRLRDHALRSGWSVQVPCYRQGECPALTNEKDWCHHDLPWQRPSFIAMLDESMGNVKKSLKFSGIALRQGTEPVATAADTISSARAGGIERLRVVSEMFVEKGRRSCYCCGESGRRLFQRNDRDRSPENAVFDTLARYDRIVVEDALARTHDVRITATTRLRVEPPAGVEPNAGMER